MRMLMKWQLGTTETSEAIRSGRMAEINKRLDELTKPEAQYFCTEGGTRTGYVFFDLADPEKRPGDDIARELDAEGPGRMGPEGKLQLPPIPTPTHRNQTGALKDDQAIDAGLIM